jgi:hypothetical protein
MALIVVDINVVDSRMSDGKVIERLMDSEVLEGEHVDRADEIVLPVIRQKRPRGERLGINVERPEAGEKIWQLDERAHFPEGPARRGLHLRCLCFYGRGLHLRRLCSFGSPLGELRRQEGGACSVIEHGSHW